MEKDSWYFRNRHKPKRTYKCQFPDCIYETTVRTQIHRHHIIPREQGGPDKDTNRIDLCPTHHTHIFIPTATKGMHSKKSDDSIVLLGWRDSTKGRVLHYIQNGEEKFA